MTNFAIAEKEITLFGKTYKARTIFIEYDKIPDRIEVCDQDSKTGVIRSHLVVCNTLNYDPKNPHHYFIKPHEFIAEVHRLNDYPEQATLSCTNNS